MSSAMCLNLDQSKILSSANGLKNTSDQRKKETEVKLSLTS